MKNKGVEWYRLMCCFLVLISHVVLGFFPRENYENSISIWLTFFAFIGAFCSLNNPGFMVVSGYYGVKTDAYKMFKYMCMIWFYSIVDFIIRLFIGVEVDIEYAVKSIFPSVTGKYWYATAYFVLLVFSPFLNKFITREEDNEVKKLNLILLVCFFVVPTFFYFSPDGNGGANWRIMLAYYVIVQSVRKYNLLEQLNTIKLVMIVLLCFAFNVVVNYPLAYLLRDTGSYDYFMPFNRPSSITVLVLAVLVFELFRRIKFERINIGMITKYVFPVYILDGTVRVLTEHYIPIFTITQKVMWKFFIMVCYVVFIFIMGILVEKVRVLLFDKFERSVYLIISRMAYRVKERIKTE